LILSMTVTRIGAVALQLTGMSGDAARFQARSALTGAGFTTTESEQVAEHPLRRRIIGLLMVLGNLGLVAASGTLILSLVGIEQQADAWRLAVLAVGLVVLYVLASSKAIDRLMCGVITWALARYTDLETRDFTTLLHLKDDYRIAELLVEPTDWMAGKTLREMNLKDEGILVLGVSGPGAAYEGAPRKDFRIAPGQTLIVYGLPEPVAELDCRCALDEGNHG
jgi:hypothetical protein